ncbi:MAG: UDP-2,3-diacylglucosamine diphosphatase, partial [Bacteroidota bacterium]
MIYFASDFHLGIDATKTSKEREKQLVRWLDQIKTDAEAIYLLGDLFFWFEYKRAVPKGYVRFLGKLAELSDQGIPIHFFTGNHDMWMFDYFETEINIKTHRTPILTEIKGKTFFIGHGDGKGPKDYGYKMLKKIFASRFCQWAFARLHPNFGLWLANTWVLKSKGEQPSSPKFYGMEHEWLYQYAIRKSKKIAADYFIFGHRHLPINALLPNGQSRYF